MITERVKFSKEYPHPFGNTWLGIEILLEPGETAEQALDKAVETVNGWYRDYRDVHGTAIAPILETQVDRGNPKESLLADIGSCKEMKVLESYKFLVKGNSELQAAYDKKAAELKK